MAKFICNKYGRTFESGKALSPDFRRLIIDKILESGGDRITRNIPCGYAYIARYFKVAPNTIKKIWKRFCNENTEERLPVSGGPRSILSEGDLELIEVLKLARGSFSLAEIWGVLDEIGDYMHAQDRNHVKFFDESGIKLSECTRRYGHSPVGERCVEICKKTPSPSFTLSALCSLAGIEYAKVINDASNTAEFLQFFEEAGQSVNATTDLPSLVVGDIIVMDNLSSHHYGGGAVLEEWLGEMGIELIYTPTYSPDLNPIEECFSKIKSVLTSEYANNVYSIKASVIAATAKVTALDMIGYYRHTGYFRL